jgi:hypothetical protein
MLDVGTDVHDGFFGHAFFEIQATVRRSDGTHHREGDQIEPHRLELRAGHSLDHLIDHAALRGDEKHPQHATVFLLELPDRVVVEHGVLDRHRDELLHLEPERGAKFLLGEVRQRDLTDDDPLVADTEPYLPTLEPALMPQLLQRLADRGRIADLAALDGARRQGNLARTHDGQRCPHQLHRADGRGPDVETDAALGHHDPSTWTDRDAKYRSTSAPRTR